MKIFGLLFLAIFFLIPVAIFAVIILIVINRTRKSEWRGEVIDKLYETKEELDRESIIKNKRRTSHFYTIVVRTEEGLTRKIAVTKEVFDSYKVGDKLIKRKGKLNPEKE
ncbi:MAG: hypothetical protein WHV67_09360 [Thermoanaerobaculia bacterium]